MRTFKHVLTDKLTYFYIILPDESTHFNKLFNIDLHGDFEYDETGLRTYLFCCEPNGDLTYRFDDRVIDIEFIEENLVKQIEIV